MPTATHPQKELRLNRDATLNGRIFTSVLFSLETWP